MREGKVIETKSGRLFMIMPRFLGDFTIQEIVWDKSTGPSSPKYSIKMIRKNGDAGWDSIKEAKDHIRHLTGEPTEQEAIQG